MSLWQNDLAENLGSPSEHEMEPSQDVAKTTRLGTTNSAGLTFRELKQSRKTTLNNHQCCIEPISPCREVMVGHRPRPGSDSTRSNDFLGG